LEESNEESSDSENAERVANKGTVGSSILSQIKVKHPSRLNLRHHDAPKAQLPVIKPDSSALKVAIKEVLPRKTASPSNSDSYATKGNEVESKSGPSPKTAQSRTPVALNRHSTRHFPMLSVLRRSVEPKNGQKAPES